MTFQSRVTIIIDFCFGSYFWIIFLGFFIRVRVFDKFNLKIFISFIIELVYF